MAGEQGPGPGPTPDEDRELIGYPDLVDGRPRVAPEANTVDDILEVKQELPPVTEEMRRAAEPPELQGERDSDGRIVITEPDEVELEGHRDEAGKIIIEAPKDPEA